MIYVRKPLALLVAALLCMFFAGCAPQMRDAGDKLPVMATNFPLYDFARAIGGEYVDARLLLPPGVEAHVYDPSPADIISIGNARVFLHGGAALEPWVERLLPAANGARVMVCDISLGLGESEDHDEENEEHDHDADHDPHLWLDPLLAQDMVDAVTAALSDADPTHREEYFANAEAYKQSLAELDEAFRDAVSGSARPLVFAGRFAFARFTEQYGLEHMEALDSCGAEAEPSARVIAEIIDAVNGEHIPYIFREGWDSPKIADAIAAQTGAETLIIWSGHNLTLDQFRNGTTFVELMMENARILKEGLR